jgi:cytoskeletal protein CcmA (bactofilin family)
MGKNDIKSGELEAFLGMNTAFEGKMIFEGLARLDGKFDGEIFSDDALIIGEAAVIKAEIKVGTLIVDGEVRGNVSAASKIEINSTGRLYGNITTPTLVIHENGLFDGSCKMEGAEETVAEMASQAEASVHREKADDDKIVDFRDKV